MSGKKDREEHRHEAKGGQHNTGEGASNPSAEIDAPRLEQPPVLPTMPPNKPARRAGKLTLPGPLPSSLGLPWLLVP
jgi:hypothetical protein